MRRRLDGLGDFRDPRFTVYPARSLLWSGVLLFLFRLGARRRLRFDLNSTAGVENLNRIAETNVGQIPHPDTLAYYLTGGCPEAVSGVRTERVRDLVRSRALERDRLLGRNYTIAIDGTGHLSFDRRHCPHCLTQEQSNGKTRYYPPVLEDGEIAALLRDEAQRLGFREVEDYVKKSGRTEEELTQALRPVAKKRLTQGLVLGKLAEQEGIEISSSEVDNKVSEIADDAEDKEKARQFFSLPQIKQSIEQSMHTQKTMDRLLEITVGKAENTTKEE